MNQFELLDVMKKHKGKRLKSKDVQAILSEKYGCITDTGNITKKLRRLCRDGYLSKEIPKSYANGRGYDYWYEGKDDEN